MITVKVGRSSIPMPGKSFPCASCHGSDGLGRTEGGVVPANITWSRLTQPVVAMTVEERTRSAYDEAAFFKAITSGVDADGNKLNVMMPRFEMAEQDLRDLVAYLKIMEQDLDSGLTEHSIALGTIVPKGGTKDALGPVVAGVLKGYFDDINRQGGIYNRQLELTVVEATTREQAVEEITGLLDGEKVFALAGAVTSGLEVEVDRLTEEKNIPMVGPLTQFPRNEDSLQRRTFYLFGGLSTQGRVLLDFAEKAISQEPLRIAVVHPDEDGLNTVADSVKSEAKTSGWAEPVVFSYPRGSFNAVNTAATLQAARVNAVLFFGSDREMSALAQEGKRNGWVPYLLLPSVSAGSGLFDLPMEFNGRVFVAYPNGPADYKPEGFAEFTAFQTRHQLPQKHLAAQVFAYTAAKVLVEGLKRAGAKLSKERFIAALEQLYEFQTGLTPVLTYGPNRRTGSQGVHVLGVDVANKRFNASSQWVAAR